jgi:hypothetical protein
MSDKAEELARQLLNKTESGKLLWTYVPEAMSGGDWLGSEKFRTDLDDGFSFFISRRVNGENKTLDFELSQPGRVVLTAQSSNFPVIGPTTRKLLEIRRSFINPDDKEKLAEPVDAPIIARFRLFSDLFHAARSSAIGGDQTIEKVQQLLEQLG